jgi:hypothetical protein
MNNKWLNQLVLIPGGNICCPFCGKPFLSWDFQIIGENDCQHDVMDLLKVYYILLNTLAEMSLLEGSNYNLSRKAREVLMNIEKMMDIKKEP